MQLYRCIAVVLLFGCCAPARTSEITLGAAGILRNSAVERQSHRCLAGKLQGFQRSSECSAIAGNKTAPTRHENCKRFTEELAAPPGTLQTDPGTPKHAILNWHAAGAVLFNPHPLSSYQIGDIICCPIGLWCFWAFSVYSLLILSVLGSWQHLGEYA